jgi:DNA-binding beta-propeller fold protein YncE
LITTLSCLFLFAACKKDEAAGEKALPVQKASAALTAAVPTGMVFAGSTHVRVIDPAKGSVAASIDLGKAINAIAVSADGAQAFVATSGGVYQVDARSRTLLGQLTSSPARNVLLAEGGKNIYVLEHDVIVEENGTRDIKPFRLKTIDLATGKATAEEEIGQRILFAMPSENGRHHLVVTEAGEIIVGSGSSKLNEGQKLELGAAPLRVRPNVVVNNGHAFVPLDGQPARVIDVNLTNGEASHVDLPNATIIRGLATTPDGRLLVVNTVKEVILVERTGRAITGRLEMAAPHQGVAISPDGKFAYLAQTIDGTGGAVGIVQLDPLAIRGKVHLDDISPWAIAATP